MSLRQRGPIEIAVFVVSLLLILGTLGFLIYDGIFQPQPPTIVIDLKTENIQRVPEGFKLELVAENIGDEAAQNARIEVVAISETGEREVAQVVLPFLPEGSTRDAVVVFSEDPRRETIEARTVSYNLP